MCVYVYVCVCVSECVFACVYEYVFVCVHVGVSEFVHVFAFLSECLSTKKFARTRVKLWGCVMSSYLNYTCNVCLCMCV